MPLRATGRWEDCAIEALLGQPQLEEATRRAGAVFRGRRIWKVMTVPPIWRFELPPETTGTTSGARHRRLDGFRGRVFGWPYLIVAHARKNAQVAAVRTGRS